MVKPGDVGPGGRKGIYRVICSKSAGGLEGGEANCGEPVNSETSNKEQGEWAAKSGRSWDLMATSRGQGE